jgi:sterol desaturase/sphingolipid hydroxylase (fatty acid hydroxylase superfamily)
MTPAQIIVMAAPVFLAAIALEWWVGRRRGRNTYRLNDALNSLSLGLMSQIVGVFSKLLAVGLYTLAFDSLALVQLPPSSPWVWLGALLGYDFLYYWLHRCGHRVAVLWAAHSVHHQSEDYNLSTALRQTSSGFIFGWLFYLPLAVAGVPPLVFATVALIDLLYQFWVHTQQVGKLGWFDRWFCAPSNHRVHHAMNDCYVDKNYGGILIVWDRLFGSYAPERDDEPCVYGTRQALRSWNPLWANVQVYRDLWLDAWRTRNWADKLRVWLKRPGWRPADVAARWPKPVFDIHQVHRFDPPMRRRHKWLAALLLALAFNATAAWLWHAHQLSGTQRLSGAVAIVAVLWWVGVLTQARRRA